MRADRCQPTLLEVCELGERAIGYCATLPLLRLIPQQDVIGVMP